MDREREQELLRILWAEQAKLGLNDYRFSQHIGVPQSTVSRLKAGKRGVGADLMFKLSDAFPSIRMFLAGRLLTSNHSEPISTEAVA